MDGVGTLLDENLKESRNRDESACARLQFEARDENHGHRPIDAGDERLRTLFAAKLNADGNALQPF